MERRELERTQTAIAETLERIEANNLQARDIALRCLPKVRAFVRATVAAQAGPVQQWKAALDEAGPKRRRLDDASALNNASLDSTASAVRTPAFGMSMRGDVSVASSTGGTPRTPAFRTQLAKTPALINFAGGVVVDSFASMDETASTVASAGARACVSVVGAAGGVAADHAAAMAAERRFSWQSELGSSIAGSSMALDASSMSEASFGVPPSALMRRPSHHGRSEGGDPAALDLSGASEIPFAPSPPLTAAQHHEEEELRSAVASAAAASAARAPLRSTGGAPPRSTRAAAVGHKRGRGVTKLKGGTASAARDLGREDAENKRRGVVVPLDLAAFPSAYRTAKSAAQLSLIFNALLRLEQARAEAITATALQRELLLAEAAEMAATEEHDAPSKWSVKRVQFLLDVLRKHGRIVTTGAARGGDAMTCRLVRQ